MVLLSLFGIKDSGTELSKRCVLIPGLDKGRRDTNKTSKAVALDACLCEVSKVGDVTLH